MQGETTLDEERELGDWLRTHEVDDALRPYQQMFASFDAGMPWVQPAPPRRHIARWHWAAAAAVAALLAIGLMLQHPRPTPAEPQPPVTAQTQPDTAVEKAAVDVDRLADIRQAKPKAKVRTTKKPEPAKLTQQDSVEVTRTAGDLELAESEYMAEQLELEQELLKLRRQRIAQQSGWHYTSLPCQ